LFQRFHTRGARHQLRFQIRPLLRQSFCFGLDLPDLLLSILNNQQLFQVRMHGPEVIGSSERRQSNVRLYR